VLVAVPLAAVIAVLAAAHGASHPASQTHHVVVAAARGLDRRSSTIERWCQG
jgi:hypothetical protein